MSNYCGHMACGETAAARRVQVQNKTSVNMVASVLILWSRPSAIVRGLGIMAASASDQVRHRQHFGVYENAVCALFAQ